MAYNIRMGIPEMEALWNDLQTKYRSGNIKKKEEQLYKKWRNALKKLAEDPMYPSLQTHEIADLSKRYGMKVWQSYLKKRPGNLSLVFYDSNGLRLNQSSGTASERPDEGNTYNRKSDAILICHYNGLCNGQCIADHPPYDKRDGPYH